jgi:hypothetical protein
VQHEHASGDRGSQRVAHVALAGQVQLMPTAGVDPEV